MDNGLTRHDATKPSAVARKIPSTGSNAKAELERLRDGICVVLSRPRNPSRTERMEPTHWTTLSLSRPIVYAAPLVRGTERFKIVIPNQTDGRSDPRTVAIFIRRHRSIDPLSEKHDLRLDT